MRWELGSAGHRTHGAPTERMRVSGESTLSLSPHCASHPVGQRRCENPRGSSPATASTPQEGQPRTAASAGSSILRASRGWAEAEARNRALHGHHAVPEPHGRGEKQRGLGRDMPEPQHAVNSRRRSSNSSAGSQRRALVSWKPDGALPTTGTARWPRPGARRRLSGTPGLHSIQHWDPVGVDGELRMQGKPHRWTGAVSVSPLLPQPVPCVSQGMMCRKGWRREAEYARGDWR